MKNLDPGKAEIFQQITRVIRKSAAVRMGVANGNFPGDPGAMHFKGGVEIERTPLPTNAATTCGADGLRQRRELEYRVSVNLGRMAHFTKR